MFPTPQPTTPLINNDSIMSNRSPAAPSSLHNTTTTTIPATTTLLNNTPAPNNPSTTAINTNTTMEGSFHSSETTKSLILTTSSSSSISKPNASLPETTKGAQKKTHKRSKMRQKVPRRYLKGPGMEIRCFLRAPRRKK